MRIASAVGAAGGFVLLLAPATAGPWAEVGDPDLRSDVEVLASAGVVDNITTQWPVPWAALLDRLDSPNALAGQPDYISEVAERLRLRGEAETKPYSVHGSAFFDAASSPTFLRGYDALGRENFQAGGTIEYVGDTTVVHLALAAQTVGKTDKQVFVPDGSYIAQRLGDTVIYAGYVPHWWGPGWISALALSTNARPMPQGGISRVSTAPFESSWLKWLGPWQAEFFVSVLDGPRVARNTIYDGLRFAFSPVEGLEIALSRTDMMCGIGHPCKPVVGYFNLDNQDNAVNIVNDEGSISVRYTGMTRQLGYAVYTEVMNEDTNPIVHSGSSHLFGASAWLPLWDGVARLTGEYADSVATRDIWGGGTFPGFAFNNYSYVDGMRYRGRTLGFSLDSDSRLMSVQADYTDVGQRNFRLTYHHAEISASQNVMGNAVTSAPVIVNMLQARVGIPLEFIPQPVRFDVEGRLQDDQPRPGRGSLATIEALLRVGL